MMGDVVTVTPAMTLATTLERPTTIAGVSYSAFVALGIASKFPR